MRTVRYTSRFRRDYRREKSGRHGRRLDAELLKTVTMLVKDEPLPRRYFDHPIGGEWAITAIATSGPDLILIYRKPDDASLELVRLGSHSELGLCEAGSSPPLQDVLIRSRNRAFRQALAIARDLAGRGDP